MFNDDHRPRGFKDIHGQKKPLKDIIAWINTWPSSKRALLIHGPPGIGKTLSIYVLKDEMNLDLIELNTSDVRDSETISRVVGNAASSQALFSSKKVILVDEVDNIKGRSDSGGMRTLAKTIDEAQNPIILIANDPYKLPASIRGKADVIRFNSLRSASIRNRLREISDMEGVNVSDSDLDAIAQRSGGDMRAAINDLESLGRDIDGPDVEKLSFRDSENSIFEGLTSVFKLKALEARKVFFDVDKPPDEIIFWIDENMPRIYHPDDVPCAYYYLSRADVFLGRVRRRQYYRFWAYAMDLMTGGVSTCHKNKLEFSRYESPSYFRYLGKTKAKRNLTKGLLRKIGEKTHSSSYDAKGYFHLLELACGELEGGINVYKYFNLDHDELELLCPSNARKIIKDVEGKKKKREKVEEKDAPKTKRKPMEKSSKGNQTSLFQF